MLAGNLAVGTLGGAFAGASAVLMGHPIYVGLLAYSLIGAAILVTASLRAMPTSAT